MKNKNLGTLTLLIVLLGLSVTAFAQPTGGGPGTPAPFGFLEILIGAGALYGAKKAHDQKRKGHS